eukprot:1336703-Rhodomonas_salina.4
MRGDVSLKDKVRSAIAYAMPDTDIAYGTVGLRDVRFKTHPSTTQYDIRKTRSRAYQPRDRYAMPGTGQV